MGTTTTHALRYADSTSNTQLWTHFQNLATDVDDTLRTKYGVIAKWKRTSTKTFLAAGSEVPVLRIDNIPLLAGIQYTFETNSVMGATAANETGILYCRLNTAGLATTASASIGSAEWTCDAVFAPRQSITLVAEYSPGSNVTASVLLGLARTGGSGNVDLVGNAGQPIILFCKAWGKAVTVSGVDL
jgi:hypothetical protein